MADGSPAVDPGLLKKALQRQMKAFFSLESDALVGEDPEAIHDMRVASRRLQEILRVILPETKDVRKLLRDIRNARRAQADARDLDVITAHLRKRRERARKGDLAGGMDLLLADLASRRVKAQQDLRRNLAKLDLRPLQSRLVDVVQNVLTGSLDTSPVAARILETLDGRDRAFREAVALAHDTLGATDLHNARIAGKRLRYILELADRVQMGNLKDRVRELRAIQESLGKWHDLEVLEEVLIGFCSNRDYIRDHTRAVQALYSLIYEGRRGKARYLKAFFNKTSGQDVNLPVVTDQGTSLQS